MDLSSVEHLPDAELETLIDEVARRNVLNTASQILLRSEVIRHSVQEGRAKVIGALYDVKTGNIEYFDPVQFPLDHAPSFAAP